LFAKPTPLNINLGSDRFAMFNKKWDIPLNIGSLELLGGVVLLLFGTLFGVTKWISSAAEGMTASAGTVMLAGLPILVGTQMILGFFAFDFVAVPSTPLQIILGLVAKSGESRTTTKSEK
jgi:hypothetical protein